MSTAGVTNKEAYAAFIQRIATHSLNIVCDADRILSYGWYEIAIWNKDKVVLRNGALYSQTTMKHFNQLKRMLEATRTPFEVSAIETPSSDARIKVKAVREVREEVDGTYYVTERGRTLTDGAFYLRVVDEGLTLEKAERMAADASELFTIENKMEVLS